MHVEFSKNSEIQECVLLKYERDDLHILKELSPFTGDDYWTGILEWTIRLKHFSFLTIFELGLHSLLEMHMKNNHKIGNFIIYSNIQDGCSAMQAVM